jgi:hypothetical protein
MVSTIKVIKYLFLCLISSEINVKVLKVLRICCKKFCEFRPRFLSLIGDFSTQINPVVMYNIAGPERVVR